MEGKRNFLGAIYQVRLLTSRDLAHEEHVAPFVVPLQDLASIPSLVVINHRTLGWN